MKNCTKCNKTFNLDFFSKDNTRTDKKSLWCKGCCKESKKKYDLNNKQKNFEYRNSRKETKTSYDASYRIENMEKLKAYEKSRKDEKSTYNSKYRKENAGKINARNAKRNAAKLEATPKWLITEQFQKIEQVYIEAARLTKETGIPHEVDHILPLQGKQVRGLHVPWNLQILTAFENISKSNKLKI